MEALMDYDGPWSPDLINLMVPVAMEAETQAAARQFNAVFAAAGSLFGKEPMQAFQRATEDSMAGVRRRQIEERGGTVDPKAPQRKAAARAVVDGFRKLAGASKKKGSGPGRGE